MRRARAIAAGAHLAAAADPRDFAGAKFAHRVEFKSIDIHGVSSLWKCECDGRAAVEVSALQGERNLTGDVSTSGCADRETTNE